jgi:very-short-patch-repair endonuclease
VDVNRVIRKLTAGQCNLVARRQLRDAGIDDRKVMTRLYSGFLEEVTPRVLRLGGSTRSESQRLLTPILHVGCEARLSHSAAAAWWGIAGCRLDPIHIALERNQHWEEDLGRVTVHHATKIPEWCRKTLVGVPVVSPGLAVYQMAGTVKPDRVARALDSAWSLRLLDGHTLDRLIAELARPGRNGSRLMRELRKARPDEWVPPASNLEHRFDQIMSTAGIVTLRRQVDLGDEEWSGRVDFLDDECPLIIEVLSERYHTALTDKKADSDRSARHAAMGFAVVEVWDHEIFFTPWIVTERVKRARRRLLKAA